MSQRVRAVKREIADAEIELRQVKNKLYNAEVFEIPANVQPISPVDIIFCLFLLVVGVVALVASFNIGDDIPFGILLFLFGILCMMHSWKDYLEEIREPKLILKYNRISEQIDMLKYELNKK